MQLVRDRWSWKFRDRELILGPRTLLMGVLDAAVGSASDAERVSPDALLEQALAMQQEGADLLDLQVFSEALEHRGRPTGSLPDADDELRRLVPILRKLRPNVALPLAVTTHHAATAERVLDLGVDIIRDWSGLCFDPPLAKVVNLRDAGLILGHSRGAPESWATLLVLADPVTGIVKDLDNSVARARAAGIDRRRIVLDPGFEQGKRGTENLIVLTNLDLLARLDQPFLVGFSGKRFLTESVRASDTERRYAETAALTTALLSGAHILRVRNIEETAFVAKFVDRLYEAAEEE